MKKLICILALILVYGGIVLFCVLATSCNTKKEIVREYIHDTIKQTSVLHDSIDRWHTHYEYLRGDTIVISDTFNAYKYVSIHDTLIQHDIEYRDKEVLKEVEKRVYVWWPTVAVLTLVAIILVYFRIKRK